MCGLTDPAAAYHWALDWRTALVQEDEQWPYSANLDDYVRLCVPCHKAFDLGRKSPISHCKRGHEFTDENTKRNARGNRVCRECERVRERNRVREPRTRAVPRASCRRAGHDWSDQRNVYVRKDGRRYCGECARERSRVNRPAGRIAFARWQEMFNESGWGAWTCGEGM